MINEDSIRKLVPEFLHLPHQAVECFMNDCEFNTPVKRDQLQYDNIRYNLLCYSK